MISLIEEKTNRDHTLENLVTKGRSVFNGRMERGLHSKEEITSTTMSQDAFFLTSIIDAIENRDKVVTDVKGACLNNKIKGTFHMKIAEQEVDFFCEIEPNFEQHITFEKGKKVLHVQLDRAL